MELRDDGERFLPWTGDPVISYEHLHRYRAVADLAGGRRVLDLACGEGYGSALLAGGAGAVVGIDVDAAAACHASRRYGCVGVGFVQGSIAELPFRSGAFDLVVCFEALEHVAEQDRLCAEAARVLASGGVFVVSTPNRPVYREAGGFENPFHVRELDLDELGALVGAHFRHVRMIGQRVYPVSALFGLDLPVERAREYVVARGEGEAEFRFVSPAAKAPRYFLCVASDAPLPDLPVDSFLVDASEQLFEVQRRAEGAVVELGRHLDARAVQVQALERDLVARAEHLRALEADLGRARALAEELDRQLRQRTEALQAEIAGLRAQIAAMERTRAWRLHQRAQALRGRLRGLRGSPPGSPGA